ncbi:MAG: septation protein A, partial [Hoeflea sp.]|nr:septation protein A [Hoeflea sp.]
MTDRKSTDAAAAEPELHIFEPDPNDPARKRMNPLLKLVLELGPLIVFFFANSRGAWIAEQ